MWRVHVKGMGNEADMILEWELHIFVRIYSKLNFHIFLVPRVSETGSELSKLEVKRMGAGDMI